MKYTLFIAGVNGTAPVASGEHFTDRPFSHDAAAIVYMDTELKSLLRYYDSVRYTLSEAGRVVLAGTRRHPPSAPISDSKEGE